LQPWVLVKLYHSTSANGVANYDDDQCDDLYGVFQHCVFNLMEFPAQSSPVFSQFQHFFCHGSHTRKKRMGTLVTGVTTCMSEPLPVKLV
jgi:hypothetical protein